VQLSKIGQVSAYVERMTGFPIAFNKPIVGRNAFAHESGIHVHGVMSNTATYEPFKPELVGVARHIVIGKHSGEHSVRGRLDELGIKFPEELMPQLMETVKETAVGDKEIDDAELRALVDHILYNDSIGEPAVKLDGVVVVTGKGVTSTATVNLSVKGEPRVMAATGVGPVDAAIRAISKAVNDKMTLEEYKLAAINGNADALCESTVMIKNAQNDGFSCVGKAVGLDVGLQQEALNLFQNPVPERGPAPSPVPCGGSRKIMFCDRVPACIMVLTLPYSPSRRFFDAVSSDRV